MGGCLFETAPTDTVELASHVAWRFGDGVGDRDASWCVCVGGARGQGPGGPWALLWLLRFWQAIRLG
jgi:hypothetical protein